jgi:hypothetical protein
MPHLIGSTGINPEVENLLKYLVSSDMNILNESDADFSVGRWVSLDSRFQ